MICKKHIYYYICINILRLIIHEQLFLQNNNNAI